MRDVCLFVKLNLTKLYLQYQKYIWWKWTERKWKSVLLILISVQLKKFLSSRYALHVFTFNVITEPSLQVFYLYDLRNALNFLNMEEGFFKVLIVSVFFLGKLKFKCKNEYDKESFIQMRFFWCRISEYHFVPRYSSSKIMLHRKYILSYETRSFKELQFSKIIHEI